MNLVVGSINYDFTIYVEEFPAEGQTISDGILRESPGGKGFNQAVASARAGVRTKFVGCVGDDTIAMALAEHISRETKRNRNFTADIITSKGSRSGCAFILVRRGDGKNKIVVSPGANRRIPKSRVQEHLRKDDFHSILLQCELEEDVVGMCVELSRKRGKRVFLNAAPFRPWVKNIYHLADFLIVNESEALELARVLRIEGDLVRFAKDLVGSFKGAVVITLGERGVIFCDGSRCFHMDAFKVKSIDAVGAGDSFCGYLAACISKGMSVEDALTIASASAAITTTRYGAAASIPYMREVMRFMRNSKVLEVRHL